jgi:hypothetical protein
MKACLCWKDAMTGEIVEVMPGCAHHGEGTPPPSTLAELNQVLIEFDASRPRSMQKELGPSEIGASCVAQIARKLAGLPEKEVTAPLWAPLQGTSIHATMEQVIGFWNLREGGPRWESERAVAIDDGITGHADAYDGAHKMIIDWKYSGTTTLRGVKAAQRKGLPPRDQIKQQYRIQGHLYGFGFEQLGYPVEWVRVVFLARSWKFADSVEWTERYNPQLVDWALLRYDAIRRTVMELDILNNPQNIALVPTTPGDECNWCPFYSPGQPTSALGCAGNEEEFERIKQRESAGLIIS